MNLPEKIKVQLSEVFAPDSQIKLMDERGDGYHFALSIISEDFEGKSRIQRSQMVYAALDNLMKTGEIHALQLQLKTPTENE